MLNSVLRIAHAGEEIAEPEGLLDTLTHQPLPLALLMVAFILLAFYGILTYFKVTFVSRLLAIIPLMLVISLVFMQHNPVVTSITLSVGFILTFLLVFGMLGADRR